MKRVGAFAVLLGWVVAFSAFQVAYAAIGILPSPGSTALTSFGLSIALALWADADARSRHQCPCYDFAFLVAIFLPVSLLWYVFWSRGWRGLWTLAALGGLMALPTLSAIVAWNLLGGLP
jgi:hypothetical protein